MNIDRVEELERYISENPGDPFNHYALAIEYKDAKPNEAITKLKWLAENHPKYGPTYYQLVHLLISIDEEDAAEDIGEKGLGILKQQNETKMYQELKNLIDTELDDF